MRLILVGGGETIETIYFLARYFAGQGHHVTIVNPNPDEARTLARRVKATIIAGDGSDPGILAEAGARQADLLLALAPYDPDNLVICQVGQKLYGVPRTLALVNDPENEAVFRQLGISQVFSATQVIGTLIRDQTTFEEVTQAIPVAEGRVQVTEVVLNEDSPATGAVLADLELPEDCLVAAILRDGQLLEAGNQSQLRVGDRLVVISSPQHQEQALHILAGEDI